MNSPEQTLKQLAQAIGFKARPGVLKNLEQLDQQFTKAFQRLQDMAEKSLAMRINEQNAKAAAYLRGESDDVGKVEFLSKAQVRESMMAERHALKAAAREIVIQAAALAKPVFLEFLKEAGAFIDHLESDHHGLCLRFHCTPGESALIAQLRQVLQMSQKRIPAPEVMTYSRPGNFLSFLK